MRPSRWLTAILALNLAGCVLRGKQQAKVPAVPPPPLQSARPQNTSAARPEPLSIPQTQAQLPPPQPIDPQALATVQQPPAPPAETQTPRRPPRPAGGRVPTPAVSRPEPAAPTAPAATVVTAPQPAPEERQLQEILPPEDLKRLQDSLTARRQEVRHVLESASARKLNSQQAATISRIQSFLQQSEEAEKRSDLRQADALGERAQILAREFQGGVH